ncbi:ATP-grasp domain-containing protein [Halomonas koreensis]|uniref:ATP-grasp domain-containing protein n=1 Tax=Halomonas koreensis TaxID=245385 RepID=A0ABU1FWV0_9GAMM|nr:ATP-grasp domain-containing protein [Halomonas koreensis]MDR5865176.1 ATP-grasp domain-containing protein [Halomonas koreensis]
MNGNARNVFVVGLNDFNRQRLETLKGAEAYRFHGLIAPAAVYDTEVFDISAMLEEATEALEAFDGRVDAIVGYMDFPVSTMLPILCDRFDTRSPSLESLLKCEHKYWSRQVQKEVIPAHIPTFTAFDPFDDDALIRIGEAGLYFPFFVKPIKSSGSRLGFRIDTPEDFYHAIERLRDDIGLIADPFNTVLEHARLPDEIAAVDGHFCMAEEIIGGWQCTVEGYVHDGEVVSYGIVDSLRYPQVLSFFHYRYPSGLPDPVQATMRELTGRVMRHIGFDDSAFNIEYFWDEAQDRIWLLEINTRISQSHCDLFEKVDGVSNQQVTIDLALGQRPAMPHRQGDYAVAAKFFHRVFFTDAVVTRVPSDEEVAALESDFPGTVIALQVEPGQRLSTLPEQDSYSYALAYIWMGAASPERLLEDYDRLIARLTFEFDEIEG